MNQPTTAAKEPKLSVEELWNDIGKHEGPRNKSMEAFADVLIGLLTLPEIKT